MKTILNLVKHTLKDTHMDDVEKLEKMKKKKKKLPETLKTGNYIDENKDILRDMLVDPEEFEESE